jgi:hypothetical protein
VVCSPFGSHPLFRRLAPWLSLGCWTAKIAALLIQSRIYRNFLRMLIVLKFEARSRTVECARDFHVSRAASRGFGI